MTRSFLRAQHGGFPPSRRADPDAQIPDGPLQGTSRGSGVCLRSPRLQKWAAEAGQTANLTAHYPGLSARLQLWRVTRTWGLTTSRLPHAEMFLWVVSIENNASFLVERPSHLVKGSPSRTGPSSCPGGCSRAGAWPWPPPDVGMEPRAPLAGAGPGWPRRQPQKEGGQPASWVCGPRGHLGPGSVGPCPPINALPSPSQNCANFWNWGPQFHFALNLTKPAGLVASPKLVLLVRARGRGWEVEAGGTCLRKLPESRRCLSGRGGLPSGASAPAPPRAGRTSGPRGRGSPEGMPTWLGGFMQPPQMRLNSPKA